MGQEISLDPVSHRFKNSMRRAASSVALITTTDATGARHGMAATAWSSVSMEPPSVLVAVNKSASIHDVIISVGRYCLNIMADDHGPLLERFSRSDLRDQRFATQDWIVGPNEVPVLDKALASLVCEVEAAHAFGTHTIFLARVKDVILAEAAGDVGVPLVWLNGKQAPLSAARR